MNRAVFYSGWVSVSAVASQLCFALIALVGQGIGISDRAQAQAVVPDGTLNTIVTRSGGSFTIDNGTTSGTNLFHSFREFSIPTGGAAIFNNAPTIQNIFSRVTGGTVSNIDGMIQAQGTTNLFLLNPSGILFRANASLNIGGSFVGTTAQSIKFADGMEFSATNLNDRPLLTMSAPIGLQMGSNSSAIQVQGTTSTGASSLQVQPQKTLALIGGDIQLVGGQIQSPGSYVTLAGLAESGTVKLNLESSNLSFSLPPEVARANVSLTQAAQINVSGRLGGSISVNARNLSLVQGSRLQAGITGIGSATALSGDIDINVAETVDLDSSTITNDVATTTSRGNSGSIKIAANSLRLTNGARLTTILQGQGSAGSLNIESRNQIVLDGSNSNGVTGIFGEMFSLGVGRVGDINITTPTLTLTNGARIANNLRGRGGTGEVNIRASETIFLDGIALNGGPTGIFGEVNSNGVGNGSTINITTASLRATNGAQIGVSTRSRQGGNAGNVNIQASNQVLFQGTSNNGRSAGIFSQVIRGAVGNGGNIDVKTEALAINNGALFDATTAGIGKGGNISLFANTVQMLQGGQVIAISQGSGNAGQIAINAKNSVTLAGTDSTYTERLATGRVANVNAASGLYASTSQGSTGAGGDLRITAGQLTIQDAAQVNVSNLGSGDAGNLKISADTLRLDTGGSLSANVQSGSKGNIQITTNTLIMRRSSQITTNAGTNSNGGSITINAPIIVGFENSDIVANAVKGRGGNITITTQGIFGLKFRPQFTPENDITASSEFGINGSVQVNNIGVDPNSGLVELSETLSDESQKVAAGCAANQGSSFVITGRGGVPQNPGDRINHPRLWSDLRTVSASTSGTAPVAAQPLLEATSWHRNSQTGKVELVAARPVSSTPSATCN